jgi:hypothetical protein
MIFPGKAGRMTGNTVAQHGASWLRMTSTVPRPQFHTPDSSGAEKNPGLACLFWLVAPSWHNPHFQKLSERAWAYTAVGAVHYRLIYVNIAVSYFKVKAAIWIGAYPCLVFDRRTLAAEIR